jgi:hypothetical protein
MPKSPSEPRTTQVTPEPALEKRTRRQFTPEYKLRILAEADACQHGELGAILRREKLYSNQLFRNGRQGAQRSQSSSEAESSSSDTISLRFLFTGYFIAYKSKGNTNSIKETFPYNPFGFTTIIKRADMNRPGF